MHYKFIKNHESDYPVDEMCECLELSRSGYYSWSSRAPSPRAVEDEVYTIKSVSASSTLKPKDVTDIVRFTVIFRMNTSAVVATALCA